MPKVTFKAKPETIYNADNSVAWVWIKVPALARKHCDMEQFRQHKRYSAYANSDLFPSLLKRALGEAGIGSHIKLDKIPACVTVVAGSLLHSVTIDLN